jgi:hypothetical protein
VEINEAWGNDQPIGIDGLVRTALSLTADLGDLSILNPYVSLTAWGTGAVNDCSPLNV